MAEQPISRGGPLYWLKRRSRWFWIIAAVLLPVLYVASIGPWFWLATSGHLPLSLVWMFHVYDPLLWIITQSPDFVMEALKTYLSLWLPAKPFEYHGP